MMAVALPPVTGVPDIHMDITCGRSVRAGMSHAAGWGMIGK